VTGLNPHGIAIPQLEFVFELRAAVAPPIVIGKIGACVRRLIPVGEGAFEGPALRGRLLPGGVDYQIVHEDGFTEVEARYVLETEAKELIYVNNRGMRHGPPDVIARLNAGQEVDPAQIYFRTVPQFETAAPGLQWLMRSIFVCAAERRPTSVAIRFYKVA
jgi:hypothetical protein